jgi:hypothetical protein
VLGGIGGLAVLVAVALSQRDASQTRLKDTEARAQQAQKNGELATSQRDALQNQLRDTEARAQQAQKNGELATSQRDALENQLKDTEARAQQAQKNGELATSQRDALENQLKDTEARAQQAQKNSELATSQRDTLQAQLRDSEARAQQAQKNVDRQDNDQALDWTQVQQKPPAPPMEATESDSTPVVPLKLETNRSGVETQRAKLRPKEASRSLAHPKAPLTKTEAFRRFDAEFDGRERAIERQILATDQRSVSASGKKKEDLKAWKKYLERRRQYVRELRRYEEVALRSKWNE